MKLDSTHAVYRRFDASCSRPQWVLMLIDGALRYTREATDHLLAGRWPEKGKAIEAAYECVAELRRGLDFEQGGDMARQLDKMYDLLSTKLTLGNVAKDATQLQHVVASLEELRSAWAELFKRLRLEGKLLDAEIEGAARSEKH